MYLRFTIIADGLLMLINDGYCFFKYFPIFVIALNIVLYDIWARHYHLRVLFMPVGLLCPHIFMSTINFNTLLMEDFVTLSVSRNWTPRYLHLVLLGDGHKRQNIVATIYNRHKHTRLALFFSFILLLFQLIIVLVSEIN